MKIEPLEVASTRYSVGLINRGFVTIKPYVTEKGKKYFALYVSDSGREFLKMI